MFTNQEKNAPLKMCVKENVYLFNKRTKKIKFISYLFYVIWLFCSSFRLMEH